MTAFKRLAAGATVLALTTMLIPQPVLAGGARLEGLVLGLDRGPAAAHRVHLIDGEGREVAVSETDREGLYGFADLGAGEYALAVADGSGRVAPVAGRPLRLGDGELARRDITLVDAERGQANAAATANYGLGVWWAGLTASAKVWTIVGVVGAVAITAAAVSDDDDPPASEFR